MALRLIKNSIFDAKLSSVEVLKCMDENFKELEFALRLNKTSIAQIKNLERLIYFLHHRL